MGLRAGRAQAKLILCLEMGKDANTTEGQGLTPATIQMSVNVKHVEHRASQVVLARRCGTLIGARGGVHCCRFTTAAGAVPRRQASCAAALAPQTRLFLHTTPKPSCTTAPCLCPLVSPPSA